MKQALSKLIHDPLTIFIVCGALVFMFYEYTLQDKRPKILLSKAAQVQLVEDFEAIRGEKASKEELADIFQSYLIDELLFQEALEEKLHLHDPATRSSLIDIMHYRIAQSIEVPSDEELVAYFASNITNYYTETTYSFTHIFFSSLPNNAQDYAVQLNNNEILAGEDFIHGNTFSNMTSGLLSGVFGKEFTANLQQLSKNEWEGPIQSNYGVHFVRLTEKLAPQVAPFSEVKQRVEDDYMQDKGDQAIMRKYKELEAKYETALEP